MPQIKSAEKRLRQTVGRTERNRAIRSAVRTQRRSVIEAIGSKDAGKAASALERYYSVLDRALGKGVIKKNFASRQKSRLQAKVNNLSVEE